MARRDSIEKRKRDHLALASTDAVAFRDATTLFECVRLVHHALPEMAADEVDLSVPLLGKRLRAPLLIASMTGGTREAAAVNRTLARIAEDRGIGFGLGSQRAMHKDARAGWTYRVRDAAPTALVLGNLGLVQAREMRSREVEALLALVGADALCVHLNPAMELVQPGGDRDFRGGVETIARLVRDLRVPVVVKETGCGLSPSVGRMLAGAGVLVVDVSGAGGTSWVGVETLRAAGAARAAGEALWDWGVPTAASVALLAAQGFGVIATGGVRTGLDVARALALGATACGIARPVLQALRRGGRKGALAYLDGVIAALAAAMLLTGSRTVQDLRNAPRVVTGELRDWMEQLG